MSALTITPYQQIEDRYRAHPQQEPFVNYVVHHHRHGFVFSRPDLFVMGRAVVRHAPTEAIRDCRVLFQRESADCWHIFAAAGDMRRMWQVAPWPLPWFCWSRLHDPLSELQFYESSRLHRLCPPDFSGRP